MAGVQQISDAVPAETVAPSASPETVAPSASTVAVVSEAKIQEFDFTQGDEQVGKKRRSRSCVDNAAKRAILIRLKNEFDNNAAKASEALGIKLSTLKDWRMKEQEIMKLNSRRDHKKTLKTYPRRALLPEMEQALFDNFLERERWAMVRDDLWIKTEAKKIVTAWPSPTVKMLSFKFSAKWLKSFKRRHKISKKRTICEKLTMQDFLPMWKEWLTGFRAFCFNYRQPLPGSSLGFLSASALYNVDESPMFLPDWMKHMNSSGLVENEVKGVHTTVDVTKRWCSLVITIRADNYAEKVLGFTTKPFPLCLIFRGTGTNMDREMTRYDKRVSVFWQPKGWFDTNVATSYQKLWHQKRIPGTKVLLVDNLHAHVTEDFTNSMLSDDDTIVKTLPPIATHFCQPVDLNVGQSLKTWMKQDFRDWWMSLQDEYKETGEVRTVSISELRVMTTKIAANAFAKLTSREHDHLVRQSFAASGISLPLDGSLDNQIKFASSKQEFLVGEFAADLRSPLDDELLLVE
eukprot:TRINITY_DN2093_c0_g1_i3.p1 TRINITY_DN2093_c0_g1~~TRINITY_DN2093_c0_g1_i3.p1  ORF type:complete len:518 (-),score=112.63 TRINITY_DN2093_c0_g1_i3:80-1633(-)